MLIFLAIRASFAFITFTCRKVPGILVNLFIFFNNLNIIYIGWFRPYDTFAQNRIELANFWLLQMLAYNIILLANLLPTPELEFIIGWSIISFIGLIFIVNMGYQLSLTIPKTFRSLYLKLLKWKRNKLLKKLKDSRKEEEN